MRRLALLAVSIAGLTLAASALAKDVNPVLDAAAIGSSQCMTPGSGAKQVVDVKFQLTNYADSGYVGAWAFDTVNRRLRIWKQTGGVFCAQISDDGSKFVTIGGFSPAGGGNLSSGVTGTFTGGYIIAGINGRFDPHYKKSGGPRPVRRQVRHAVHLQGRVSVVDQLLQRGEVGRVLGLGLALRRRVVGFLARPGEHLASARRRHPHLEERRSRPVAQGRLRRAGVRPRSGPGRAAPGRAG